MINKNKCSIETYWNVQRNLLKSFESSLIFCINEDLINENRGLELLIIDVEETIVNNEGKEEIITKSEERDYCLFIIPKEIFEGINSKNELQCLNKEKTS